jgi:hypothetical protein
MDVYIGKKSLAEYFNSIKPQNSKQKMSWELSEKIFEQTDLKNSFSSNGGSYEKKLSKDFEEWVKIKNTPASE